MIVHIPVQANDDGILDAQQHVVMFGRGVDAFMVGKYDVCDDYWLPLARAGDPMAARNMGLLFQHGLGVRKDIEEAVLYYKIAADKGVTTAQLVLGLMYLKGEEISQNLPEALRYLTAASDANNPVAQWNLGLMYENGLGVLPSKEHALQLFHQSARGGYEKAVLKLGGGKSQDPDIVPQVVRDAAKDLGKGTDSFGKGTDFTKPEQLTLDAKKEIFEKAENSKRKDAINFVKKLQSDEPDYMFKGNNIYEKKTIPSPNFKNPFDVTAKDNVMKKDDGEIDLFSVQETDDDRSMIVAEQAFAKKDYTKAREIWEGLFKKGSGEAGYRLGKLYIDAKGVKQDDIKAYCYLRDGASYGNAKARNALDALRATLNEKEFAARERICIEQ